MNNLASIFRKITMGILPLTALAGSLQGCECADRIVHVEITREQAKTLSKMQEADGAIDLETCKQLCSGAVLNPNEEWVDDVSFISSCELKVEKDPADPGEGHIMLACFLPEDCIAGRRPPALARAQSMGTSPLGIWFAHVAHLEAAAVYAFAAMHQELAFHGAPIALRRAARRASMDEVAHTCLVAQLARRFGGIIRAPEVGPFVIRSLEALALDNATEGCVLETYAALDATWGHHTSRDPAIRAVLGRIATDETRHAELSWAIERWLRLRSPDPALWRHIEAKRRAKITSLRAGVTKPLPRSLIEIAGRPGPEDAAKLIDALDARLWRG